MMKKSKCYFYKNEVILLMYVKRLFLFVQKPSDRRLARRRQRLEPPHQGRREERPGIVVT